jgi:hypothetical protein
MKYILGRVMIKILELMPYLLTASRRLKNLTARRWEKVACRRPKNPASTRM